MHRIRECHCLFDGTDSTYELRIQYKSTAINIFQLKWRQVNFTKSLQFSDIDAVYDVNGYGLNYENKIKNRYIGNYFVHNLSASPNAHIKRTRMSDNCIIVRANVVSACAFHWNISYFQKCHWKLHGEHYSHLENWMQYLRTRNITILESCYVATVVCRMSTNQRKRKEKCVLSRRTTSLSLTLNVC